MSGYTPVACRPSLIASRGGLQGFICVAISQAGCGLGGEGVAIFEIIQWNASAALHGDATRRDTSRITCPVVRAFVAFCNSAFPKWDWRWLDAPLRRNKTIWITSNFAKQPCPRDRTKQRVKWRTFSIVLPTLRHVADRSFLLFCPFNFARDAGRRKCRSREDVARGLFSRTFN